MTGAVADRAGRTADLEAEGALLRESADVEMGGVGEHTGSGRRSRREETGDLSRRRLTRGPLLVARLGRVVASLECAAVLPRAGDPGAGPCHVALLRAEDQCTFGGPVTGSGR